VGHRVDIFGLDRVFEEVEVVGFERAADGDGLGWGQAVDHVDHHVDVGADSIAHGFDALDGGADQAAVAELIESSRKRAEGVEAHGGEALCHALPRPIG
tara:strand:- start:5885 stop:6181 length:297 start_codon:yes stop_codon:yes gene_type:complete